MIDAPIGARYSAASTSSSRPPLRIAVLLDSYQQPRWVCRIIEEMAASSITELALVIRTDDTERRRSSRESFLYSIYSVIDKRLFDGPPYAFEERTIEPMISACPVMHIKRRATGHAGDFTTEDLSAIRQYEIDVVLYLGTSPLDGVIPSIARCGIWAYDHADGVLFQGGPSGFWEVMESHPTTGAVLRRLPDKTEAGHVIYRSSALTDPWSVRRNAVNCHWRSSTFVMRALRELYEKGSLSARTDSYSRAWIPYTKQPYRMPGNARMLALLGRLSGQYLRKKLVHLSHFDQWILAYKLQHGPAQLNEVFYDFNLLIPPKDRFWADPFPVRHGDRLFIFFEELLYENRIGHLSVVEIQPDGTVGAARTVLKTPYHLSYPFVFRWLGTYYMVPESSQAKNVQLYRCTSFPDQWVFERDLLTNVTAVDTTLVEVEGLWWMFVSIEVEGVKDLFELNLFYSDSPVGPWTPHSFNPVKADIGARPAGRIIERDGVLYRPSQSAYGRSILIHRIDRLTPEEFCETQVSSIQPTWAKNIVGTHTFNTIDGLTVIDGLRRRRR